MSDGRPYHSRTGHARFLPASDGLFEDARVCRVSGAKKPRPAPASPGAGASAGLLAMHRTHASGRLRAISQGGP